MKRRSFLVATAVLLIPLFVDMLVRTMLLPASNQQPAISDWFALSYLAVLPFYATYVAIVLAILGLYNQYMRKSKSNNK